MQLTRQYIIDRLKDTTVDALAREIATETSKHLTGGQIVNMDATISKFKAMIEPLAPIKAVDLMRDNGVKVVEVE